MKNNSVTVGAVNFVSNDFISELLMNDEYECMIVYLQTSGFHCNVSVYNYLF